MENQKNDNLNMLEAIVQNTEMGKNTLDQLVPMAEDEQFKAELLRQRNIYRQLNQEAHAAIDACGGSAQGQSAMAKLNTKVSIGMKTSPTNPPATSPRCSPRAAAWAWWTASNPRRTTRTPRRGRRG